MGSSEATKPARTEPAAARREQAAGRGKGKEVGAKWCIVVIDDRTTTLVVVQLSSLLTTGRLSDISFGSREQALSAVEEVYRFVGRRRLYGTGSPEDLQEALQQEANLDYMEAAVLRAAFEQHIGQFGLLGGRS